MSTAVLRSCSRFAWAAITLLVTCAVGSRAAVSRPSFIFKPSLRLTYVRGQTMIPPSTAALASTKNRAITRQCPRTARHTSAASRRACGWSSGAACGTGRGDREERAAAGRPGGGRRRGGGPPAASGAPARSPRRIPRSGEDPSRSLRTPERERKGYGLSRSPARRGRGGAGEVFGGLSPPRSLPPVGTTGAVGVEDRQGPRHGSRAPRSSSSDRRIRSGSKDGHPRSDRRQRSRR